MNVETRYVVIANPLSGTGKKSDIPIDRNIFKKWACSSNILFVNLLQYKSFNTSTYSICSKYFTLTCQRARFVNNSFYFSRCCYIMLWLYVGLFAICRPL